MQISIRTEFKQAQRFARHLSKQAVPRAAARAINDTTRTVRAEGAREIKKQHPALKVGDIKREMSVRKAHQRDLRGSVGVKGRPMSLLRFGARQIRSGTSARIGKGRRRVVTYHGRKAFQIPSYGNEVFVRRDATGRSIRRFRGPSMPGVFRAQGRKFKRMAEERFPKAFKSRMDYEIARAKRSVR